MGDGDEADDGDDVILWPAGGNRSSSPSVQRARVLYSAQARSCAESDQCATLEQIHEPCRTEERRDARDSGTEVKSSSSS